MLYGAGRISAAGLGYIHGNLPGAYAGDKIFRVLYKRYSGVKKSSKMSPTTSSTKHMGIQLRRARKRIKTIRGSKGTSRSGSSISSFRSFRRGTSTVGSKSSINSSRSGGVYHSAVIKPKSGKKVAIKKKHVPKVSKKFKEMVHRANEPELVRGTHVYHYPTGGFALNSGDLANNQQAMWPGTNLGLDQGGYSFTVDYFMKCASILFNGALTTVNASNWTPSATNVSLDPTVTKFYIRNSWSSYEIKNNTQRIITLRVFEVAPKAPQPFNCASTGTPGGVKNVAGVMTGTADALGFADPLTMYQKAIADDFVNGSLYSTCIPTVTGSNSGLAAITSTILDTGVGISPSFKNNFKVGMLREFKLEPGQEAKFRVEGPNQMEFDSAKYWRESFLNSLQKWSRGIIFTLKLDVVSGESATPTFQAPGRWTLFTNDDAIGVERKDFCMIDMPESAVAVTSNTKGRRSAHVIDTVIPTVSSIAIAKEVLEQNPVSFAAT
nr:MAG: capsid protein [Cressdnaviricota sp.]